nr:cation:dicarboxylase symporter family transporter [Saccharopolyspora erythraea]
MKALVYFEVVTTIALIAGLVVMDVFEPGRGLNADPNASQLSGSAEKYLQTSESQNWYGFLVQIIPRSVVGAFAEGNVLQVLLVAILFALAIKALGSRGKLLVRGIVRVGEAVFGVVELVMYLAPLGPSARWLTPRASSGLGRCPIWAA